MKVRILSGNQAGRVVEQSKTEAEINIAGGFAVAVKEAAPVAPAAAAEEEQPKPPKAPKQPKPPKAPKQPKPPKAKEEKPA